MTLGDIKADLLFKDGSIHKEGIYIKSSWCVVEEVGGQYDHQIGDWVGQQTITFILARTKKDGTHVFIEE